MKYVTQSIFFLLLSLSISCSDDEGGIINPDTQGPEEPTLEFRDVDISFNLVNLNWQAVTGESDQTIVYDIYLGETKIKENNKDTDYTLTKLEANTEYSGRIVPKALPKNKKAKVTPKLSPILFTFKTKQFSNPDAPTPEISNVSVTNITDIAAILNWDTATISDGSEITYNIYIDGDLVTSNLSETSFTFDNLEANTTYKGILLAISTNQKSTAVDFEFTTSLNPDVEPLTSFTFFRGNAISAPANSRIQLITIFSPADANTSVLNWISSDESIASVDEFGYVFTKNPGVTTITATSKDKPDITASIEITVTDRLPSNQRYINVAQSRSSVLIGGTKKIQVTDTNSGPGDTRDFLFTSSDPNIATIDNEGNVKGVALGTVAITVTSASNPELKDSAMLRVVKDPIPIAELIFNFDNPRTLYVGEGQSIVPRILPIDATNKELIFTSTNTNIIEISSTRFARAINPGNASVIITSMADNSISVTREFNVIEDPISYNESTGIYNAPANSKVTLEMSGIVDLEEGSTLEFVSIGFMFSVKNTKGEELLLPFEQQLSGNYQVDNSDPRFPPFAFFTEFVEFTMPSDEEVIIEVSVIYFDSNNILISTPELRISNDMGPSKRALLREDQIIFE